MKNLFTILMISLSFASFSQNTSNKSGNAIQMENEVWQMEQQYWKYVENDDTVSYKTLWHENFIGYPRNDVADKSHIAGWITDFVKDKNRKYSFELHKKAVNAIDDVVMTFYDVDKIITDNENKLISKETRKITHTWKKYGKTWLIIGGMAGGK